MNQTPQLITETHQATLATILRDRVKASPDNVAYLQYSQSNKDWINFTWRQIYAKVAQVQASLLAEGLKAGDKLAIMLSNCHEWVLFDQAAQGLGLVVVPIYTNDRADNVDYILQDAEVRLLVIENSTQLSSLSDIQESLAKLARVVSVRPLSDAAPVANAIGFDDWLDTTDAEVICETLDPGSLATIVYTSGTTGKPKGVMLSHRNILNNVYSGLRMVDVYEDDLFLSFLPLSHMLERMTGYYLPIISGSTVAYSRSIPLLANDLLAIKPTIMVSVPRIFERVYGKIIDKLENESPLKQKLFRMAVAAGWQQFEHRQGHASWTPLLLLQPLLDSLVGAKVREKLGGRLRLTVCGGAALSDKISEFFIGLGIPILQGYGLTETSPVISVNTLTSNIPASIGLPLDGIEVRIGENDEILTRSDSVMLGYWHNDEATQGVIDADGWFHTGDRGKLENGHLFITGRIKDIIVLANGEKVPPSDMEMAIALDPIVEQVMIIGEARPYLTALVVLAEGVEFDPQDKELQKTLMQKIKSALHDFPGYAKVRRVTICPEPWSVENGLLTPTLKTKRARIEAAYADEIAQMYEGHS